MELAEQAELVADDASKRRLAGLAVSLDAGNGRARTIIDGLPPAPNDTLCKRADEARQSGEFTRARALYEQLESQSAAAECRGQGLVALVDAEHDHGPTRFMNFFADSTATWIVAGLAFLAGVLAAVVVRIRVRGAVGWGVTLLAASALVCWQWVYGPSAGTDLPGAAGLSPAMWWLVGLLVLAAVAGLLAANAARRRTPLSIQVTGPAADVVGPMVLTELHQLAVAPPEDTLAVHGTDLVEEDLSGVLEQVKHPVVQALLTVWRMVSLRSQDRLVVDLVETQGAPTGAAVTLYRGGRVRATRGVEGADFWVGAAPSDQERQTARRDICIGVAAEILILERSGKEDRLYGATSARSIALAAVAATRFFDYFDEQAEVLYARAVDDDARNMSARFGLASVRLTQHPSGREGENWIAELQAQRAFFTQHPKPQVKNSPLAWRVTYTLAAALLNHAVTGREIDATLLGTDHVRDVFGQANDLLTELRADPMPSQVATDEPLWRRLSEMATTAGYAADLDGIKVEDLLKVPLASPWVVLLNVACGLVVARARSTDKDDRDVLAEQAMDRIRVAGTSPRRRTSLLDDPYIVSLRNTRAFQDLARQWQPPAPRATGWSRLASWRPSRRRSVAPPMLW